MINFPSSLDALTNPSPTDQVATVSHSAQHSNANDAIEALEAKVGVDGSAVTTSFDYKLGEVITTDKAVGKSATQTVSNKTLTNPKIVNNDAITDENGNEQLQFLTTASAVNQITVKNGITATAPILGVAGGDTNIDLSLQGKGSGNVKFGTASIKLPNADGANGQVLTTNGSGTASWATPSGGSTSTTSMPKIILPTMAVANIGRSVNTAMYFSMIDVPETITVSKVTFWVNSFTAAGTFKIALFSQDGATQLFSLTSASVSSANQTVSTSISPTVVAAGKYYLASLSTGTGNYELASYDAGTSYTNFNFLSGESYYQGYKTVTASTMPSSFDPASSVTADRYGGIVVRLDN